MMVQYYNCDNGIKSVNGVTIIEEANLCGVVVFAESTTTL